MSSLTQKPGNREGVQRWRGLAFLKSELEFVLVVMTRDGESILNATTVRPRKGYLEAPQYPVALLPRCHSLGGGNMDNTTLFIIIVVLLLLIVGGWYGRGRWY